MNLKIVTDSSSNLFSLAGVPYACVPLKIRAGDKEYVDDAGLDLKGMVEDLKAYKGKSGSSCPNVQEWLDAFEGADWVFGVTITKNLSGSYNAARQAADAYLEDHPQAKVFIFDSLSAGPELAMIAQKIKERYEAGDDFETIRDTVLDYQNHNHTLFCLQSLTNLARNGRVNPAIAKVAGMLNIRIVGEARGGQIAQWHKPRGEKKAIQTLIQCMKERGFYDGAELRLSHCFAEDQAHAFLEAVKAEFPNTKVTLEHTTALCSYYAEVGGLILGYQGGFCEVNDNTKF